LIEQKKVIIVFFWKKLINTLCPQYSVRKPKSTDKILRRDRFIAKALLHTHATMGAIAKKAGVSIGAVHLRNKQTLDGTPIRSLDVTRKNQTAQLDKVRHLSHVRDPASRKNHFSKKEKGDLLKKHAAGIAEVARTWYFGATLSSWLIRDEFGTFDNFIVQINDHVFNSLDYFDPEKKSDTIRNNGLFLWMRGAAHFFCLSASSRLRYHHTKNGLRVEAHMNGGQDVDHEQQLAHANQQHQGGGVYVNPRAKIFLKKMMNLEKIAPRITSMESFRELLLHMGKNPPVNLTDEELTILDGRLQGKTLEQVGNDLGVTKEWVRVQEKTVIDRMKLEMAALEKLRE
jgi:hypothetical protein